VPGWALYNFSWGAFVGLSKITVPVSLSNTFDPGDTVIVVSIGLVSFGATDAISLPLASNAFCPCDNLNILPSCSVAGDSNKRLPSLSNAFCPGFNFIISSSVSS